MTTASNHSFTDRLNAKAEQRRADYEAGKAKRAAELAENLESVKRAGKGIGSGVRELAREVDLPTFQGVTYTEDAISYRGEFQSLEGVTAHVETAGELVRRSTLTRAAIGGFTFGGAGAIVGALIQKKKDTRALYLMVDGPTFAWVVKVPLRQDEAARRFAAKLNAGGRTA